jgi:hypothetical protein
LAGLVFNEPARWNIQALTDVEVMVLSKSAYDALGDKIENWTTLEKLFIVGCFAHLENRVNNHLSLTAEQRYDLYFESNKTLFNHVPLHYIASMLGLTRETFSRIRKKEACDSSHGAENPRAFCQCGQLLSENNYRIYLFHLFCVLAFSTCCSRCHSGFGEVAPRDVLRIFWRAAN